MLSTCKPLLDSLPGYIYIKDLEMKNQYANQAYADFGGFDDPNHFPDVTDKLILESILEPGKFGVNDYINIFEDEHQSAINNKKTCLLDLHEYKNGLKGFYTTKSLLQSEQEKPIGVIVQATSLPSFNDHIYLSLASQHSIKMSAPTLHNFQKNTALPNNFEKLTPRELTCIYHMLRGQSAKQIANRLGISPKTVESHIENIKSKLEFASKSDLISYFFDNHLCYRDK